jgi:DeoR family fructose operon transcriptional repressor
MVMFAEERKQKILDMLREHSKILVPELCKTFGMSPATIRNDLRELDEAGLLKRTHGGAIANEQVLYELFTQQKIVKNIAEKSAIARYAAGLIREGDCIALDTGTTTLELAKLICSIKNLTVVLNDIDIARYLEENSDIHVVMAGGSLRRGFHCVTGTLTVQDIRCFNVDKAFIATNGITTNGISTPDISQAEVKRAMIEIAGQVIVLADSTKLGRELFVNVCRIHSIDLLIIDNNGNQNEIQSLLEKGLELVEVSLK